MIASRDWFKVRAVVEVVVEVGAEDVAANVRQSSASEWRITESGSIIMAAVVVVRRGREEDVVVVVVGEG